MSTVDKIAARAQTIRPARVLLAVLASPLYLLGLLVGVVFVVGVWLLAGAQEGFEAGRRSIPIGRE